MAYPCPLGLGLFCICAATEFPQWSIFIGIRSVAMSQLIEVISLSLRRDQDSAASVLEALGESKHITFSKTPELSSQYRAVQDRDISEVWDWITKSTPLLIRVIPTPSSLNPHCRPAIPSRPLQRKNSHPGRNPTTTSARQP